MSNKYDYKLLPYLQSFIKDLLQDYQRETDELFPLFINFTINDKTIFPIKNLNSEEEHIGTIMLDNNFENLEINEKNNCFTVDLSIQGQMETVSIPFSNITMIAVPDCKFGLDLSGMIQKHQKESRSAPKILEIL